MVCTTAAASRIISGLGGVFVGYLTDSQVAPAPFSKEDQIIIDEARLSGNWQEPVYRITSQFLRFAGYILTSVGGAMSSDCPTLDCFPLLKGSATDDSFSCSTKALLSIGFGMVAMVAAARLQSYGNATSSGYLQSKAGIAAKEKAQRFEKYKAKNFIREGFEEEERKFQSNRMLQQSRVSGPLVQRGDFYRTNPQIVTYAGGDTVSNQ